MSKKYVRPEKTPAYLSVSYPQGSGQRTASLTIEDAISGATIVDLEIDISQWALALTSLQARPCRIDFRPKNFGLLSEHKEEFVPVPEGASYNCREHEDEALAPFEVDGWSARRGDYGNHHRGSLGTGFSVTFSRFVKPTEEKLKARLAKFAEREEAEKGYFR